jgi:hypothetical protein
MKSNVVVFDKQRIFTLEEVQGILPVIIKITKKHSEEVQRLIMRLESLQGTNDEMVMQLESRVNKLVNSWQTKIEKLGGHPKGLWIADFDAGDGYYCWKYPEEEILFWHGYSDGYCGRIRIEKGLERIHSVAGNAKDM